jgi:hypothetical protein
MVQPLVSLCCIESSGFLMMRLAYKMRSAMLVGAIKDFRSSEFTLFAEIELRKCTSKYILKTGSEKIVLCLSYFITTVQTTLIFRNISNFA